MLQKIFGGFKAVGVGGKRIFYLGDFAVELDVGELGCFQKVDLALIDKGKGGIGVVDFYLKLLGGYG